MKKNKLLFLSIIRSISVIVFEFIQRLFIDILTLFISPILGVAVCGFFSFVTVRSFIDLYKNKNWKPIIIQIVTILLLIFLPFNHYL